jgi:hypothetical protein
MGSVGTPILEDLDPYPRPTRIPDYTLSWEELPKAIPGGSRHSDLAVSRDDRVGWRPGVCTHGLTSDSVAEKRQQLWRFSATLNFDDELSHA